MIFGVDGMGVTGVTGTAGKGVVARHAILESPCVGASQPYDARLFLTARNTSTMPGCDWILVRRTKSTMESCRAVFLRTKSTHDGRLSGSVSSNTAGIARSMSGRDKGTGAKRPEQILSKSRRRLCAAARGVACVRRSMENGGCRVSIS